MPPLVILGATALAAALPLFVWSVIAGRDPQRAAALALLERYVVIEVEEARAPRPSVAQRLATPGTVARLNRLLVRAGQPPAWPLGRLLLAKLVFLTAGLAFGMFFLSTGMSSGRMLLVGATIAVAYFVPDLLLYSRGLERQRKIGRELPDTLDQMTIAVEAGLGFEGAMARVAHNGSGPLAYELVRALQDMQVGRSRRAAYEAMAERTTVADLRTFIRAIIRADVYGVAVADVLRTQAGEMRMKRRQRAEEKAMQVPVKVIFPLMLCILPVLFIVLLGPAILNALATF